MQNGFRAVASSLVALFLIAALSGCESESTPPAAPPPAAEASSATPPSSQADAGAIAASFTPRFAALIDSGFQMESVRGSADLQDMGQCGDMMRRNLATLDQLNKEFSAATSALPIHERLGPALEPLQNAQATMRQCLTCVPGATSSCEESSAALTK
jgi:hypothetical protein